MSYVNPISSSNLIHQIAVTHSAKEEVPADLKVEQVVRATVVESADDRVLLELAHRQFEVKTSIPLKKGQVIPVQVLETQPVLKLKLMGDLLSERIGHVIHRFSENPSIFSLLSSLITKDSFLGVSLPGSLKAALMLMGRSLGAQGGVTQEQLMSHGKALGLDMEGLLAKGDGLGALQGMKGMLSGIEYLLENSDRPALESIFSTLRGIEGFAAKSEFAKALQGFSQVIRQVSELQEGASWGRSLHGVFSRFEQFLARGDLGQAAGLLANLFGEVVAPSGSGQATLLKVLSEELKLVQSQIDTAKGAEGAQMLRSALRLAGESGYFEKSAMVPMEARLDAVEAMFARGELSAPSLLKELSIEFQRQIEGFQSFRAVSANAQLEGIQLRIEQGDLRGALELMRAATLAFIGGEARRELAAAEEVSEVLQGLEALQLARVKLSQEGTIFLPLLFPFLEHGFLVSERRPGSRDGEGEELPCMLSLHLRLQGLGNLQVDLLYENKGILLRIQCEDESALEFVRSYRDELEEALSIEKLYGISFSLGSQDSSAELVGRLFPSHHSFEARV